MSARFLLAALMLSLGGCAVGGDNPGFIGPPGQWVADPAAMSTARPEGYPAPPMAIQVIPDVPL